MQLLLLLKRALMRAVEVVFEQDARIGRILHHWVANLNVQFSRLKVLVSRVAQNHTLLNTDLAKTVKVDDGKGSEVEACVRRRVS